MGAPKQRWTEAEEEALKAGVRKHGPGKWRTILRDPDFEHVLKLRTNVDLKDKWRNLSVAASGYGSREKAMMALKKCRQVGVEREFTDLVIDAKPLSVCREPLRIVEEEDEEEDEQVREDEEGNSGVRLDILIVEAIKKLKEASKKSIMTYIEAEYCAPLDFSKLLSSKLDALMSSGILIMVNKKYRIATKSSSSDRRSTGTFSLDKRQREHGAKRLTKTHVDAELARMGSMTSEEAAAFAAKAVAEAEVAISDAAQAARIAEDAEADAEAAQAFLQAAMLTLKNKSPATVMLEA